MVEAERLGFSHGWTFDGHVLWQEPFVIYSRMLQATESMVVGPMVTNPGTPRLDRSRFALRHPQRHVRRQDDLWDGSGDSALRYIGAPPTTLETMVESMAVIRPGRR